MITKFLDKMPNYTQWRKRQQAEKEKKMLENYKAIVNEAFSVYAGTFAAMGLMLEGFELHKHCDEVSGIKLSFKSERMKNSRDTMSVFISTDKIDPLNIYLAVLLEFVSHIIDYLKLAEARLDDFLIRNEAKLRAIDTTEKILKGDQEW